MAFNNHAAWLKAQNQPLSVESAPYTEPGLGQLVVKTGAVAINPVDSAQQTKGVLVKKWPCIIGCDVAGTVVAVGPGVKSFQNGDRVTAMCTHSNGLSDVPAMGDAFAAFQEYVVLMESGVAKLPPSVAFEQGAVLPLGVATATASLFSEKGLGLPMPPSSEGNGKTIIIWGGSSSVGSCAIQLAKASGFEVFTLASKRNHDYCLSLGANQVMDYSDPDIVDQVVTALKGKTVGGTMAAVSNDKLLEQLSSIVLKTSGSKKLVSVIPGDEKKMPEGIDGSFTDAATIPHGHLGPAIFVDFLTKALAEGSFKCKPDPQVIGKGLEHVQKGFDIISAGVSRTKIVISL